MKVILKSERDHYQQALDAYEQRLAEHHQHVLDVDAVNEEAQQQHQETLQTLRDKAEEQYLFAVTEHEERESDRQRWIDDGADPELFANIPPPPEAPMPIPDVREPDMQEPPPDPVFSFPAPTVYDAREVEEPEEVDTPWGVTIAMPGTIIVTGADGSFVVPAATFASDYDEGEG